MIVERTNAMAVAFSPIDNMENFATPFYHANQKLKAYLSDPTSNASVMRKMVELVDEQMFAPAYPSVLGRKVENIRYKVGSLIYMAKNSITMEDMMWKLNGADLEALYSLHLESRNEAPFSERSLKYFLSACTVYYYQTDGEDLFNKCLMDIAKKLADEMGLSEAEVRMDSMDIAANMRNLSRLELLYIGVERCVIALHRLGKYDLLVDYESYLDHENYNAYVYDKTTNRAQRRRRREERTQETIDKAVRLVSLCYEAGIKESDLTELRQLVRVLREQTEPAEEAKARADKAKAAGSSAKAASSAQNARAAAHEETTGSTEGAGQSAGNVEAEADEAQAENSSDENTVSAADAAEEDQTVSSAQNARAAAHEETDAHTEDAGQAAGNVEAGADKAQDENCSAENTVSAAGAAEKDQAVSSAQGACSGTASGESPIGSGPRTLIPDDDDRLRSKAMQNPTCEEAACRQKYGMKDEIPKGYKSTFAERFADGEGVAVAWATYRDGLPTTRAGQRF